MAMTNEELMQILTETGAYQSGHFKLSSGLHSANYIQCSQLLKFPRVAEKVCSEIAAMFKDDNIEMVVGPAIGGILVAYEVGRALNVPAIFAERENGARRLFQEESPEMYCTRGASPRPRYQRTDGICQGYRDRTGSGTQLARYRLRQTLCGCGQRRDEGRQRYGGKLAEGQ